jgi:hypothetical protein
MYKVIIMAAIALGLCTNAPIAKAGSDSRPDADALVAQVKQLASLGQDAKTTAEVNQFVDQNHDMIGAMLIGYMNYFKHIQAMMNDDEASTSVQPKSASGTSSRDAALVNTPDQAASQGSQNNILLLQGGPQSASLQPSSGLQTSSMQPSSGVQSASIQPSSELQTFHLAGYPSLPDVAPISSVTQPTAGQLEYAEKVQREVLARKAYLMAHPEGYTY